MAAARCVLPIGNELRLVDNQQEVLDGSDALVIITDWKEFKNPDFDAIKARLNQPVVIDGRNLCEPALIQTPGIECIGIGHAAPLLDPAQRGSTHSPG
jgi:UDPglucose 6-dehydrogenase